MNTPHAFIIEGLDRLGKSTLISNIIDAHGYFEVIHFQKPKVLPCHMERVEWIWGMTSDRPLKFRSKEDHARYLYQFSSFSEMMKMLRADIRFIFDRAHLGECVYSPLYRGYSGDYVFDLEMIYDVQSVEGIRMILLTEDFDKSRHFVDDGLSFDVTKRRAEQQLFIDAFNKSNIRDKRIICVTDEDGNFRSQQSILEEALK